MDEEDSPGAEWGATENTKQGGYSQEVKPGPKQSESSKYLYRGTWELLQPARCLLCVFRSSSVCCSLACVPLLGPGCVGSRTGPTCQLLHIKTSGPSCHPEGHHFEPDVMTEWQLGVAPVDKELSIFCVWEVAPTKYLRTRWALPALLRYVQVSFLQACNMTALHYLSEIRSSHLTCYGH